jgi:hypothetical protein
MINQESRKQHERIRVRLAQLVRIRNRGRSLIVANNYLESEVGELMKAVSHAYVRGRFHTYSG